MAQAQEDFVWEWDHINSTSHAYVMRRLEHICASLKVRRAHARMLADQAKDKDARKHAFEEILYLTFKISSLGAAIKKLKDAITDDAHSDEPPR